MSNEHTNETKGIGKIEPENLWPEDFGTITIVPPVTILRQQAALLGQITRNVLIGEVKTGEAISDDLTTKLVHRFYIVAPALGDYRYQLLMAHHLPFLMYPVTVWFSNSEKEEAFDEASLRNILKSKFASDETKVIVQSLVAQSMATATT